MAWILPLTNHHHLIPHKAQVKNEVNELFSRGVGFPSVEHGSAKIEIHKCGNSTKEQLKECAGPTPSYFPRPLKLPRARGNQAAHCPNFKISFLPLLGVISFLNLYPVLVKVALAATTKYSSGKNMKFLKL